MIHLTPQQLSSYMDGELNEASTELVRRHMGTCEECTLKFAALEEQEELLARTLVHDPGDEFFERFTADVQRQLTGAKETGGRSGTSSVAARAKAARTAPAPAPPRAAVAEPARSIEPAKPVARPEPVERSVPVELPEPVESMDPVESMEPVERSERVERSEPVEPVRHSPPRTPAATPDPIGGWEPLESRDPDPSLDSDTWRELVAKAEHSSPSKEASTSYDTTPPASSAIPPAFSATPPAPSTPKPVPPARAERIASPAHRPKPPARPVVRRPKIHRPAPAIPWYAAVILVLISSAASVVASRMEPVSAWLDSRAPRSTAPPSDPAPTIESPAPAQSPVPAPPATAGEDESVVEDESEPESGIGGTDTEEPKPQEAVRFLRSEAPATGSAKESQGQRDPFASLPPSAQAQVRAAQRSGQAASGDPSAGRYEAAASEWERVIPLLAGKPQQTIGWFELASARFRAWEMDSTPDRAASATTAIRAYLATAPQGPARDQARAWMTRLSP